MSTKNVRSFFLSIFLAALVLGVPAAAEEMSSARIDGGVDRLVAAAQGRAQVSRHTVTGAARFVHFPAGSLPALTDKASVAAEADAFFSTYGAAFGVADSSRQLRRLDQRNDGHMQHVIFQQVHEGIPVFGGELRAHFDADGRLLAANGTFLPELEVDTRPSWSRDAAIAKAIRLVEGQHAGEIRTLDLAAVQVGLRIYQQGLLQGVAGTRHLVYEVEVANSDVTIHEYLYIDAHHGKLVNQITGIRHALDRAVSETSLANVVWTETDPDPIPSGWAGGSAQQVTDWQNEIDGARETYNLFGSMTGGTYLSYDGNMATMRTVNNDPNISCPNANWNGISTNYCSNVTGDDTVAHEWGHAYTEYTNNLIYQWQSGALNESYSDIWGEVVDLLNGRGTDAPGGPRSDGGCSIFGIGSPSVDNTYRWLSGEDDPAFGGAIRDMWHPVCYNDPGKVTDTAQYRCSAADSGGVHTNSGVPNHAFALMVDGGTYNGQTVNGIGLVKASHIHWAAQNLLTISSNFSDHADALDMACAVLVGAPLFDLSTSSPSGVVSSEVISAADCAEVSTVIAATELRTEPTFCNFTKLLDPAAPALCTGEGNVVSFDLQDWESGLGGWTVGTRAVVNPATFDTPDWAVVGSLPDSELGSAAFVADIQNLGDCVSDLESGVLYLESPVLAVPASAADVRLAFDHWVATEAGWDGGNVKVSVNSGAYQLVPASAYTFNSYNSTLNPVSAGSDNPMAGEAAFTGTDEGSVSGSWGQSQISLVGIAAPGDNLQIRFEMGLDGCNGVIGWYVDEVQLHSCDGVAGPCGNGQLDAGEACDDGNTSSGDGCSDSCQVEPGWTCTAPTPPTQSSNVMADGSFEAGSPNPSWTEASLNFGTPICSVAICGGPPPSDGLYHVWFGGIPVYEAGSVEQSVVIPTTATDLEFDLTVGVCDSANDYMRVLVDGTQVFTTDPCTAGPAGTESVSLGALADGASHTVRFESETFGTAGGNSNFFLDNVVISDNLGGPGSPSVCTQVGCTEEFGPTWGKWNLPPTGGTTFGVSARLDDPAGNQVYYFRADLTDTGGGGKLVGTLHDGNPGAAYEVRGIYVITDPGAYGSFEARIFPVGTDVAVGKIGGSWRDRPALDSIGRYKGEWKICD